MDLEKALRFIVEDFAESKVPYALIGGMALGAWGIVRSTMDLDFLVLREDRGRVERVMLDRLYRLVHASEDVSQYASDLKPLGSVDFIHAFRAMARAIIARAAEVAVFGGALTVRVALPEDIIGLKVQAMHNDPGRAERERSDIRLLLERHRDRLDWALLGDYFELFSDDAAVRQLRSELDAFER